MVTFYIRYAMPVSRWQVIWGPPRSPPVGSPHRDQSCQTKVGTWPNQPSESSPRNWGLGWKWPIYNCSFPAEDHNAVASIVSILSTPSPEREKKADTEMHSEQLLSNFLIQGISEAQLLCCSQIWWHRSYPGFPVFFTIASPSRLEYHRDTRSVWFLLVHS